MLPCFNTAGSCVPGKHYLLPPEARLQQIMRLVDEEKYFTIHAGRQTGKTTAARWLVQHYNARGPYWAMWVDIETAREQPDPPVAFREILLELGRSVRRDLGGAAQAAPEAEVELMLRAPSSAVLEYLQRLCARLTRPLVVLVDEADGLVGPTMVSFLTQLRRGYLDRSSTPFAHSLALIGMRQVRDYVMSTEDRRAVSWLGTTSPFNITAEAATLTPFSRHDVAELLGQHSAHTGQRFEPEAAGLIYELSQGHPWLVNAVADQIVNRDVEDRSVAVTAEHVLAAKETIIVERRSHIDSLVARLREERVRRILDAMLVGAHPPVDIVDDDVAYVLGLGLVAMRDGQLQIANPIYREVIPRALTWVQQVGIHQPTAWYVRPDGGLDMAKLMAAWQVFWRKDGHLAAEGFRYREAGPHLMLMAFLQRIVNTGGRLDREYGLGRGALDLMIFWKEDRHVIEVKLRRDTETEQEGIEQLGRYLDRAGLDEGWLVLFDLRQEVAWEQRLFVREIEAQGKRLRVVGC
ncbi:MAG: ATP-binding protein [Deltaproteobacteria bacterium]|nr:ATP-binding protein [Deltaproteobacteria bacterium]